MRLAPLAFSLMIALLTTIAPFANRAGASVLFEGYSKVLLDGVHVGYVVQRYDFDPKKKEFTTVYMLKTNQAGGNITESLKARASQSLTPISYQYTELVGERARTIDATFKGDAMTAIVKTDGKQETLRKQIPKGAFLASFLAYLMLQGKEGLKKDVKYGYQAIAEEDANLYAGEAFVTSEEVVNGVSAFKVLNTFKGMQFASYVTHKGEVVATKSPLQKIETALVPTINEATAGISLNSNTLMQLFGSVPKGAENVIARKALDPGAGKKDAVPAGKGIVVKGGASTPEEATVAAPKAAPPEAQAPVAIKPPPAGTPATEKKE